MPKSNLSIHERFMKKVCVTDSCWLWMASKSWKGYGGFGVNSGVMPAHRFSYELFKGKIPNGLLVHHVCRNPSCVNPEHLETVTNKENSRNTDLHGWHLSLKTHCIHGHEYNKKNTYYCSDGGRRCRVCARINESKRRGVEYIESEKT